MENLSNIKKGFVLALLGATCWGISGVLGEYMLNISKIDPLWIITTRLFYSGLLMLIVVLVKKRKEAFIIFKNKKDTFMLFNFSFLGLFICQSTYFMAIKYTNAGTATVLQYIGPVMIMAYYCLVRKRLPLFNEFLAIVFSLVGVVVIATHFDFNNLAVSTLGLFWGIFSAVGLASYNIFSVSLTKKYGATIVTAWGLFIAGIVIYFSTGSFYIPSEFGIVDLLCMIGVVIVGTIMSFTVYLEGVRLIGAVRGSIISCFEPIAAIIFSFLILGTTFSFLDILGAASILMAVVLLAKR